MLVTSGIQILILGLVVWIIRAVILIEAVLGFSFLAGGTWGFTRCAQMSSSRRLGSCGISLSDHFQPQ